MEKSRRRRDRQRARAKQLHYLNTRNEAYARYRDYQLQHFEQSQQIEETIRAEKSNGCTLFVSNIAYSVTAKELGKFLTEKIASAVSTTGRSGSKRSASIEGHNYIPKCTIHSAHRRSKGHGLVFLRDKKHRDLLIKLSQLGLLQIGDRNIRITEDDKGRRLEDAVLLGGSFSLSSVEIGSVITSPGNSSKLSETFVSRYTVPRAMLINFESSIAGCFEIFVGSADMNYKFQFSNRRVMYVDIQRSSRTDGIVLQIQLQQPPMIFKQESSIFGGSASDDAFVWRDGDETGLLGRSWIRTLASDLPSSVLGTCLTYRFTLDDTSKTTANILRYLNRYRGLPWEFHNLRLEDLSFCSPAISALASSPVTALEDAKQNYHAALLSLSFSVAYLVECLVTCGKMDCIAFYLFPDLSLINEFFDKLRGLLPADAEVILQHLLLDASVEYISAPLETLNHVIEAFEDGYENFYQQAAETISDSHIYVRRVFITPLRIVAKIPELDLSNRILQQWQAWQHRFIRITFADEHFGFPMNFSDELFEDRVRHVMKHGIVVTTRRYCFLAYSSSQLRERAAWFYDEGPDHPLDGQGNSVPSIAMIRESIGDLSQITSIGKFGARMGLAFSTALASVNVPCRNCLTIPEVETTVTSRTTTGKEFKLAFSDGVGIMNEALAKLITKRLKLADIPSAVQIRYGGCKGMLSLVLSATANNGGQQYQAAIDCNLDDFIPQLAVRESMLKFPSSHEELQILTIARTMPAYLNRQLIPLLTHLGVKDQCIKDILNKHLSFIEQALHHNEAALELLRSNPSNSGEDYGGAEEVLNGGYSPYDIRRFDCFMSVCDGNALCYHALSSGFDITTEPLMNDLMRSMCSRILLQIQQKARILLPHAVCLIGVLDEYDVLKEGEVFVQYCSSHYHHTAAAAGGGGGGYYGNHILNDIDVTVGRNPSLHPGDIRVLHAINHPALRHLHNVIVFPRHGTRPLPSMMSGGDLDGDIYFVLFDNDLVPSRHTQVPPLDYHDLGVVPRVKPVIDFNDIFLGGIAHLLRNIDLNSAGKAASQPQARRSVEDQVSDYFVDYMKNDNLGRIAIAHMIFADKEGVMSSNCIELAKLHSIAVDFAKSGIPAEYPSSLNYTNAPDFMERFNKVSYESPKLLGYIYRRTRSFRKIFNESASSYAEAAKVRVDRTLCIPGREEFLEEAEHMLYHYNDKLSQIMRLFEIHEESDILHGQSSTHPGGTSRAGEPARDMNVRLQRSVRRLRREYLSIFWEEFIDELDAFLATFAAPPVARESHENKEAAEAPGAIVAAAQAVEGEEDATEGEEDNEDDKYDRIPFSRLPLPVQQRAMCKASAWYDVTYSAARYSRGRQALLSFAWIPLRCLCEIKRNAMLHTAGHK